jgi:hypothetical protein
MKKLHVFLLLGCVTAGASFVTISLAHDADSDRPSIIQGQAGPMMVSRSNPAAVPALADVLPAFSRPQSSRDLTPRGGLIFGARVNVDVGASRRLYGDGGHAVFAAPSPDRSKVCFAVTEDKPNPLWGAKFCAQAATVRRADPLVWSVNTFRTARGPRVLVWGVAARDVSAVTIGSGAGASAAPTPDGIFLFDVSGSAVPEGIMALNGQRRVVAAQAIPRGIGVPLPH